MNARQRLANEGCVQLYRGVPDEFTNNLRHAIRHDGFTWSNGTWDGEAYDGFRTGAVLPDALSHVMAETFRPHYVTFFPHTSGTEWSLVRTAAGSRDSPVCRDFALPEADVAAELNALPGMLLVATQDDTMLYGYGWNSMVAFQSNARTIVLNKGDILLMRGDYMYSPAGYTTTNLLLHANLDTDFYLRELEGTEPTLVTVIDDTAAAEDVFCHVHNSQLSICGIGQDIATEILEPLPRLHLRGSETSASVMVIINGTACDSFFLGP